MFHPNDQLRGSYLQSFDRQLVEQIEMAARRPAQSNSARRTTANGANTRPPLELRSLNRNPQKAA